ncbi:MAG: hypothetical protein JW963_21310 [Anaerolineales bacterium]|nr:hypothetical protein [Anaerolineales bacterium]
MSEDPAITRAKRLVQERRTKEAFSVLVQRIGELRESAESSVTTSSSWIPGALGFSIGAILALALTLGALAATGNLGGSDGSSPDTVVVEVTSAPATPTAVPPEAIPTWTPESTPLPPTAQQGNLSEPLAVGVPIEYAEGKLEILEVYRPIGFPVAKLGGSYLEQDWEPALGAEFVGVRLRFTCGKTICDTVPEALPYLILDDGSSIDYEYVMIHNMLGEDEIARNYTDDGWIVFQVPQQATLQSLKVRATGGQTLYAQLPASIDGYSVESPWFVSSSGGESYLLPAMRRDLKNAGVNVVADGASLRRSQGTTFMAVMIHTEEVIFFEDHEVLSEARHALETAAELWSTYDTGEADEMDIYLFDPYGNLVAQVAIERGYLSSYAQGAIGFNTILTEADVFISD